MSTKIERRSFGELRAAAGDEPCISGYAATFNVLSKEISGFREIIRKGAFNRSLSSGADVCCLQQHDATKVLGRRSAGTLSLMEDERGLKFECHLDANNSDHMNLRASVLRGDIKECSFAFTVPDGGDQWDEGTDERGQKFVRRTLTDVELFEISAVIFPVYNQPGSTEVSARAAAEDTTASRLAKLRLQQADWQRSERAHEIGMALLRDVNLVKKENRDMQDFASMREQFQSALPKYRVVGNDDDHIYAVDDSDEDDLSVYRFSYACNEDGDVDVDKNSRVRLSHTEVSAVRSDDIYAAFRARDLAARMRSASGITTR